MRDGKSWFHMGMVSDMSFQLANQVLLLQRNSEIEQLHLEDC